MPLLQQAPMLQWFGGIAGSREIAGSPSLGTLPHRVRQAGGGCERAARREYLWYPNSCLKESLGGTRIRSGAVHRLRLKIEPASGDRL
jgi:hypothetical protein